MRKRSNHRILIILIIVLFALLAGMLWFLFRSPHHLKVPQNTAPIETEATAEIPETVPKTTEAPTEPPTEAPTEPEEESPYPTKAKVAEDGTIYNPVPKYNQQDYPKVYYAGGSVAAYGSNMTVMAMVCSYLKNEEILPDALAERFRDETYSMSERIDDVTICLDMSCKKTDSMTSVTRALKDGRVVVLENNPQSLFTKMQHFLVLYGITPEGRILVHDPMGSNYDKEPLKEGFEKGFTKDQLKQGFVQAWIFDFYQPPAPATSMYHNLELSQYDKEVLAKLIWLEARGEPFEGQQAVAEVVLNRLVSDRFDPDTVYGIIMSRNQFRSSSMMKTARVNQLQLKAIERALTGPNILPPDVFYFATFQATDRPWGTIGSHIFCYPGTSDYHR